MLSHPHFHHSGIGTRWNSINLALAMLIALLFLIFLLLFLIMTATPAQAQRVVPPTAAQSAKMPEFASKLAHGLPGTQQPHVSRRSLSHPRDSNSPRGPLDPNELYDNGPTDGEDYAWTINFGYTVTDSFPLSQNNSIVNGMSFAAWLFPGDLLQSVEVSITSSPFGGTVFFDQVVNLVSGNCTSNGGFNICIGSASLPNVTLNAGTYWLNLQNAVVNDGDPAYWDQNSGPSLAENNSVGTIPSESFSILGSTGTSWSNGDNYACPPPQTGFSDLHELPANAASSGLAIDTGGHLYGSATGGANGQGMLYGLVHGVSNWFFTTLYSFLGGSNGSTPWQVIAGPDGDLYGSASGGIQSCGSDGSAYCGLIFKASPILCGRTSCGWNETTLYRFTANNDALGGTVSAFDSAGNLYGVSATGGAYQQGAVFKLTSSQGGWSETILYSFTGANDGANPNSLLVGHDGNLYGTAAYGGSYQSGVVFRLIPSGETWIESVLYTFTDSGSADGFSPGGLIQDSYGNLYGFSTCFSGDYTTCDGGFYYDWYGLVFLLTPSPWNTKWNFSVVYNNVFDCAGNKNLIHTLSFDSQDTLYAAQGGADLSCNLNGCYTYYCGQVIKVGQGALITGNADIFTNLTSDANGHLFGATQTCGFGTSGRNEGMVWEYSP